MKGNCGRHPGGRVDVLEESLSAVCRTDPMSLILDLTRRLAEEFDPLPLPLVTRAVKAAVDASALFGEETRSSLGTIEQIARENLIAIRATAGAATTVAE